MLIKTDHPFLFLKIEQLSSKHSNYLTSNHKSYFITTLNITTKQVQVYPLSEFNKWVNKENIEACH